jgi:hypothetical protein
MLRRRRSIVKTDLDLVLNQISSPTEAESKIAQTRLALGVAPHLIVAELLARRDENERGAKLREEDQRADELIQGLADAGLLDEMHDDEYLTAIRRVRDGELVQSVVDAVASQVKSRREQKTRSGAEPK